MMFYPKGGKCKIPYPVSNDIPTERGSEDLLSNTGETHNAIPARKQVREHISREQSDSEGMQGVCAHHMAVHPFT